MHSHSSNRLARLLSLATAGFATTGLLASPVLASDLILDEVVVTAPRMAAPLVIETDPSKARTPVPAADGAGYLKTIPGFNVIRKGGIDGDPIFRGQAGSRLNVLLDGTPLMGGCGGRMDPPTAYVFPESYDKIVVLKGPQSVIHGGGAMGATILMERNTKPFSEPGLRANSSALLGSWGRNDQMIDVTGGAKPGYVRIVGTRSASDDYKDGAGRKVHSEYDRKSATVLAGWTPDDKTVIEASLDVSAAEAAYADRIMDGVKFDRRDLKLEFTRTDVSPLVGEINAQIYHNYIDHVMDRFSMRRYTGGAGGALNNPDRTNTGGKVQVDLTPGADTEVKLGADYNEDKRTIRNLSAAEYLAGADYKSKRRIDDMGFTAWGVFGEVSHDLSAVNRVIGGYRLNRVDTVDYDGIGRPTDSDTLHNGFGRYEHDVDVGIPLTTYVGLGHTQRSPDFWERTKRFQTENEKATQLDIGALHKAGNWHGAVSAYYSHIEDYILVSSATTKNVTARTIGGEAEVGYRFLPSWTVQGTIAYVHGTNISESKALPQMTPLDTTLGVRYDDGVFTGGLLVRAVAGQTRTDAGWGNIVGADVGETGGFATLSLNGGWRPNDIVTVSAGIDNLLDKTYAEHVSKAGTATLAAEGFEQTSRVYEPGRTLWVKGSVKF